MSEYQIERAVAVLAAKFKVTDQSDINLIRRAVKQSNDSLVIDNEVLGPKQWRNFKAELGPMLYQPTIWFRKPHNKNLPAANNNANCVKCLVLGPCGNGKSSTINNICKSNLVAGSASQSLTRDVTQVESFYKYETPFVFYDTPGTTAKLDKLRHASLVKSLLEFAPVNCVVILVRWINRADQMIQLMNTQTKMIPGFEKNILFLITHFDEIEKPANQEIAVIEGCLNKYLPDFSNQILFFSNHTVDPKQLSDTIYQIARSFQQVQVKIDHKTFMKHFNLKKEDMEELFFGASERQTSKQMEELADDYIELAKSLPDDGDRQAIFQDIEVVLKNQLLDMLDEYTNKHKQTILSCEYFETYFTLQLKKNAHLRRFQDQIRSMRKIQKFIQSQATGNKLDIRDLIKQCPSCHLIWFRIQACPNTSCGSRPSCIFDYIKKPISRFKIFRDKFTKKISFSKAKTQQDFLSLRIKQGDKGKKFQNINKDTLTQEKEANGKTIKERMEKGKAVGCGQAMNFQTLPRIPDIDKHLMEWYGTHTVDEAIEMFQRDEDLQKTRKEIEAKARMSFLSFRF